MPRNGSGQYNRTQPDYVFGTIIDETAVNSELNDIATALTQSIAKDGQTPIIANLPMSGFRHTGVGGSTARNQYATTSQTQDGAYVFAEDTGAVNAYVIAPSPPVTTHVKGMRWRVNIANANTGASTLVVSGLPPVSIKTQTGSDPVANQIPAGLSDFTFDGTNYEIKVPIETSVNSLNDIGDVNAPSPSLNDLLQWNGSEWVNAAPTPPSAGFQNIRFFGYPTSFADTFTTNFAVDNNLTLDSGSPNPSMAPIVGTRTVFRLSTTGTLPSPLAPNTDYYIESSSAATLALSATPGGAQIVLTDNGTGTHTFAPLGIWTKPAGLVRVRVKPVGGGGGGYGVSGQVGTGGAGGGTADKLLEASALGATEPITVGSGGAGGTSGVGTAGGTSSFGTHCSATGGGTPQAGGGGGDANGAIGGKGVGGDINIGGQSTDGARGTSQGSGAGGSSTMGGGGRGIAQSGQGFPGEVYGGGGGGGYTAGGAAGAQGCVMIEEYF